MKVTNVVIAASFVLLLVSFWNRNNLPRNVVLLPALADEPKQSPTNKRSFEAVYNDVEYRVEPEYEYELHGMIVSYRHHDGKSRMHLRSSDHLNMLDVCVVWGDNATNPLLHKLDFWNGIFTCNVQTRNTAAWESFDMEQLSNNHLISDDEEIRDSVQKIRVGDQIRIRGVLAKYESPGGERGTSITRTDTGDGACETIYVDHFEIVMPATSGWRISMYTTLVILIASLVWHFSRPFKRHKT